MVLETKRTNEDGTPDKRHRVTEEKKKEHSDLKPHKSMSS